MFDKRKMKVDMLMFRFSQLSAFLTFLLTERKITKETYDDVKDNATMIESEMVDMVVELWKKEKEYEKEIEKQRAEFVKKIDEYKEALIWCGGSDDFQYPNGKARKGWEKIVKTLI